MSKRDGTFAIGVDIGGTGIKAGIVSSSGRIVRSLNLATGSGRAEVLKNIGAAVANLLADPGKGVAKSAIIGIGADTPGLTDSRANVVAGAANIPGWNGAPLGDFLRDKFGLPVRAENDVTALTLGESLFGNGRPFKNLISLAFGTGLGGGIIMDRRIYRGRDGYAAEFGHLIVDSSPDAPACTCGAKGCLETFASRVGIERMLKEFLPRYPRTLLKKDSTPRDVYGLAVKGDPAAKAVVKEVGERLGAGLASLVNVFNPDAVLLGGGIVSAGKIFFDSFRPAYERLVLPFYRHRTVKFVRPRFGSEGGLVGAASLILQDVVLKNETEPRPGRTISESRKTKTKG